MASKSCAFVIIATTQIMLMRLMRHTRSAFSGTGMTTYGIPKNRGALDNDEEERLLLMSRCLEDRNRRGTDHGIEHTRILDQLPDPICDEPY
jgi:hypothetical protein